jgi:NADH-quinone oxidoreductase subunit G
MAQISINGQWIEAKENALLIDVLLQQGVNVPHFCYHPALGKDGNCRMCMVEIEGKKRPQISCDTLVSEGLVVRTEGENIDRVKRSILELELLNHPVDCPICDQAGECKLQEYYMDVGLYESRLEIPKEHGEKKRDLGANVILDQERCVLCTRCVRFTEKITHTHELAVFGRGDHAVIDTYPGKPLQNAYAMNVVDLCPVGALTSKAFRFQKRVWFLKTFSAICSGCAKGCNLYVDHHKAKYEEDIIYRYRPRFNEQVNGHFICDAGRLLYEAESASRLSRASLHGSSVTMEILMSHIKAQLQNPECIVVLSGSLSLEEMWLAKTLPAKVVVSQWEEATFEDDYLKKADREMNSTGAKTLGFDIVNEPQSIVAQASFVVLVGVKNLSTWEAACKAYHVPFGVMHAHQSSSAAAWVLPIASHMERAGHFINTDNMLQYSDSGMKKEKPALSVEAVLCQCLDAKPAVSDWTTEIRPWFAAKGFHE